MFSYYDLIRNEIFESPEQFDAWLDGETIHHDEEFIHLDVSEGSGFHARVRGRYRSKLGKPQGAPKDAP